MGSGLAIYVHGDPSAEKLGLVLPGLCDTQRYPHMRSHVNLLANLGFYVLSFDMPGTWQSDGDIGQFTTTNCLEAIDRIIARENKPTVVVGHSNGGRLGALAASRNRKIIALACIMSAATTYSEGAADEWRSAGVKISLRDDPNDPDKQHRFELPYSFYEDAAQYNGRAALQDLDIPKLFIAGARDEIVPLQEIVETFRLAATPKEMNVLDCGHDYRRDPIAIEQVNVLIEHFLSTQGITRWNL